MLNNFVPQIYNKSLEKLKAQVAEHNPDCINVMLDATEALSSRSASIAEVSSSSLSSSLCLPSLSSSFQQSFFFISKFMQVIPIINTIVLSLSTDTGDDHGVKGLKKELLAGMVKRLGHLEELEIYSVATLLHPR